MKLLGNISSNQDITNKQYVDNGLSEYVPLSQKGANSGVASLGLDGKVPSSQLPERESDVVEGYYFNGAFYADAEYQTQIQAEANKIYIDLTEKVCYIWDGTNYVKLEDSSAMYTQNIVGDGTTTDFTVAHNLGTNDIIVEVYDTTNGDNVIVDVERTTVNAVQISFESAPLANETFRVLVVASTNAIANSPMLLDSYETEADLLSDDPKEGNYVVGYAEGYTPNWVIQSLAAILYSDGIMDARYTMLDGKDKSDYTWDPSTRYIFLDNAYSERIVCQNSALLNTCNGVSISATGSSTRVGYRVYNKDTYAYYADVSPVSPAGATDPSYTINLTTIQASLPSGVSVDDCLISFIAINTGGTITDPQQILQYVTLDLQNAKGLEESKNYIVYYANGTAKRICPINYIPASSQYVGKSVSYNSYGRQYGRHVHIYHFGGGGNDWCFVRTPVNYDPNRIEPYPFVICNHGNGWVMNGTEQFANWTKRTMYVPLNDPDYIANPTQYNGTDNSSLWYSNPTIEYFLSNGYIVCGCENYGDGLFGNNECRNACTDFYYHMVANYNVTKRCFMIGASNGAMTALNAAYLLGDRIAAMVLQYPLTCLWNQYVAHPQHQEAIRNAYGITDPNVSEATFKSVTRTHDPLFVNVVANTKVGYLPPIKFYYSSTDTVTPASANSEALISLLENSNLIYSAVQIDSGGGTMEHGDYRHFDPQAYYDWFEEYK